MNNTNNTAEKQQVIGRPFPKGVSGNPAGRPKGSFSIKDRIRQYLDEHPDDVEKIVKYFVTENKELLWKMLEGSPKATTDIKIEQEELTEFAEDELLLAQQILERKRDKPFELREQKGD